MERSSAGQVLGIEELNFGYGRIQAIRGVQLEVRRSEIVALVGPNGGGKSTLMSLISGLARPSTGSITFEGVRITHLGAEARARLGITLVPEGRGVLGTMTVEENLAMGSYCREGDKKVAGELRDMKNLFPILNTRRRQAAATLSGGEQQILVIARALMAAPKLLLLDEPSLGLSPIAMNEVFGIIKGLKARGFTVLLAEQNARKALDCADWAYIIRNGTVTNSGAPESMLNDRSIREAFLGGGR